MSVPLLENNLSRVHSLSTAYKVAVLTFKIRTPATPPYLHFHLDNQTSGTRRSLRSSVLPLLSVPVTRTNFARRAFAYAPLLMELHWLRVPQRIHFRLACLAHRCLHGLGPTYLSRELRRVSDVTSRPGLRSNSSSSLVVPRTNRSTIDDRAFPVTASRCWNALPSSVTNATSYFAFKRSLKTHLFNCSFNR